MEAMNAKEPQHNLDRIRRIGRRLEAVCLVAAIAVVPLIALYWMFFNGLPPDMTSEAGRLADLRLLPAWVRGLCFTAALVPGVALLVTLLRLRGLFSLYKVGYIFSLANVVAFRALARSLFAWAVASILYTPLHGLAVSAANPPGRHMLSLGIGGTELALFFVSAMVMVIARVMDEARRLDEEQALTV